MDMKVLALLALFLVPSVLAISIGIEIDEKIDGHMSWLNVTSLSPQKFSVTWENLGSFYCRTRARIGFYNESRRIYASWGSEEVMKPGDTITWDLYSYLYSGAYNYTVTIYHCNEIFEFGPYPLAVWNITPIENAIEIMNSIADEDSIELTIRSSKDLSNVIVIPERYPATWIFEAGKIETIRSGELKTVKMNYEPINWEGETISFVATTENGNYAQRKPIILRKQEASYDSLIFILIMVVALLIYLYFKKINFLVWRR